MDELLRRVAFFCALGALACLLGALVLEAVAVDLTDLLVDGDAYDRLLVALYLGPDVFGLGLAVVLLLRCRRGADPHDLANTGLAVGLAFVAFRLLRNHLPDFVGSSWDWAGDLTQLALILCVLLALATALLVVSVGVRRVRRHGSDAVTGLGAPAVLVALGLLIASAQVVLTPRASYPDEVSRAADLPAPYIVVGAILLALAVGVVTGAVIASDRRATLFGGSCTVVLLVTGLLLFFQREYADSPQTVTESRLTGDDALDYAVRVAARSASQWAATGVALGLAVVLAGRAFFRLLHSPSTGTWSGGAAQPPPPGGPPGWQRPPGQASPQGPPPGWSSPQGPTPGWSLPQGRPPGWSSPQGRPPGTPPPPSAPRADQTQELPNRPAGT